MTYVNLDPNYFGHLQTKRLIDRLGNGSDVLPIRLFCYTAKHYARDGRLAGHTAQDIESAIGWWGEPGKCVKAMTEKGIGFLERDKAGYFVHNWTKHNGHLSAFSIRATKAANARWKKDGVMLEHPPSIAQAQGGNATNQPANPNPPTNPPIPAGGGSGNGQGPGQAGNLSRELRRLSENPEANRQLEVHSLLTNIGVLADSCITLSRRTDITPRRVSDEVARLKRQNGVADLPALLVHRLTNGDKS